MLFTIALVLIVWMITGGGDDDDVKEKTQEEKEWENASAGECTGGRRFVSGGCVCPPGQAYEPLESGGEDQCLKECPCN